MGDPSQFVEVKRESHSHALCDSWPSAGRVQLIRLSIRIFQLGCASHGVFSACVRDCWKKSICAPGDWSVARDGRIRRALPTRPGQEIIWFALVYQEKVCEQVQNHCRFNRARALASENLSHTFSRLSLALVEFPVSSGLASAAASAPICRALLISGARSRLPIRAQLDAGSVACCARFQRP